MRHSLSLPSLALLAALAWSPGSALAQDGPPPSGNALTIDIGPGAVVAPRYPGADQYRVLPIPAFDVRYRDVAFASFQDGIGLNLIRHGALTAGPLARPDFGRTAKDTRRYLPGLSRVGFGAELGGFARFQISPALSVKLEARQAVGGHKGFNADISASYFKLLPGGVVFVAGPKLTFNDARYQRAYFGVTPAQSRASGLRPFAPDGGFGSAGAGAVVVLPVLPRVTAVAFGSYARLLGDAAPSPVTTGRNGSRDQVVGGLSFSYRFSVF